MYEVVLPGIRPEPLAAYLKGIGILRAVGEQVDEDAGIAWRAQGLVLRSPLDRDGVGAFLLERWRPTPFVAPWNGGSGFYPKDQQSGLRAIETSSDDRFESYRRAIAIAREALKVLGITSKDEVKQQKPALLQLLRARLADDALRWIDAAVVLSEDGPSYPPLLGTGGNDGRLEFSNNQMQRLAELLLSERAAPLAEEQLGGALFGASTRLQSDVPIGQFAPGQAGGANTTAGFDRQSLVNPWDFVLALEGAAAFAAAASRTLETTRGTAFPFFVRDASPSGFGSASESEDARGELWLPLWSRFATLGELIALVGEGRLWVGTRQARSGVDVVRAIHGLGVTRGVEAFQRFVIAQRNGLAYFATSGGRFHVSGRARPDPLGYLDGWLDSVRGVVRREATVPASVRRALRLVDEAAFVSGADADMEERLLLALGALSAKLMSSRRHQALQRIRPLPAAPPGTWRALAASRDPVWRVAMAAGAARLRPSLQPVTSSPTPAWVESFPREHELGAGVPVLLRLARAAGRALYAGELPMRTPSSDGLALDDIAGLASGEVDETRLGAALEAALLTDESALLAERPEPAATDDGPPLALGVVTCLAALVGPPARAEPWPVPVALIEALARGRGDRALRTARDHLKAHAPPLVVPDTDLSDVTARRLAATVLLPFTVTAHRSIWNAIAPPT